MLFDQLFCIRRVTWRRSFNSVKALILSISVCSAFFLVNIPLNFTIKYKNGFQNLTDFEYFIKSKNCVWWIRVSLHGNSAKETN